MTASRCVLSQVTSSLAGLLRRRPISLGDLLPLRIAVRSAANLGKQEGRSRPGVEPGERHVTLLEPLPLTLAGSTSCRQTLNLDRPLEISALHLLVSGDFFDGSPASQPSVC